MIDSIWSKDFHGGRRFPRLRGEKTADVAVVGGGMAGVLCADALRRAGLEVVVLERERIGCGQTGGTSAKITSQHGAIYHRLIRDGLDTARAYAEANEWAVRTFKERIRTGGIECDLEEREAYVYALRDKDLILREYDAQRAAGLAVRKTEAEALPFEVVCAIGLRGQAQFHPLKFLHAIARDLTVFENSAVTAVHGGDVYTAHGCVHAKYVVFACHYPIQRMAGLFAARMHQERESVLALERAPIPAGMWVSAEEDGVSLRSYGRLTLMCGVPHRTGEGRGSAYAELDRRAAQMFGSCRTVAHWSAQDCITASGKPYIGRFCLARPNWMVATGFGKWGMTSSMVASRIITELICDRPCRWRNLYAPSSASFSDLGGIAKELAHATKGLARVALSIPSESVDALPPGHGGVVFLNGKRAGVYKELDGKVHAVRPVCPHLGCLLEWNDDEKTWDCPCHGSRFDYRGRLIDTPARHDLKEI